MASISSLSAPGVEVREYDESLRIQSNAGTTVFIPGFAQQGPVEEIITITSITDFENIYGIPTNAAERYFYYTVLAVLENSSEGTTVLTSRLAYGANEGDNVATAYTLLAYPAIPVVKNTTNEKGYTYWHIPNNDDEPNPFTLAKIVANGIRGDDKTEGSFIPTKVTSEIILKHAYAGSVNNRTEVKIDLKKSLIKKYIETSPANTKSEAVFDVTLKVPAKGIPDNPKVFNAEGCNSTVCVSSDGTTATVEIAFPIAKGDLVYGNALITLTYGEEVAAVLETPNGELKFINENAIMASVKDAFENIDLTATNAYTPSSDDVTYLIGAPAMYNVSLEEYYEIISGDYFANENRWASKPYASFANNAGSSLGSDLKNAIKNAAFIAINTSRGTINDSYEGLYFGLTDNMFNEPSDDYVLNSINAVQFTGWTRDSSITENRGLVDKVTLSDEFTKIGSNRLDFYLDSNTRGSISNILQSTTTGFETDSEEYDDTLNMGIFKLTKSTVGTEAMKLTYSIVELFNASLGKTRTYSISGAVRPQSYFVETLTEGSKHITMIVNPHIADKIHIDINGKLRGKVRTYSSKLVDNYKFYEGKYLTNSISVPDSTPKTAINIAKVNIANWGTLVNRIGVPLEFLAEIEANSGNTWELFNKTDALYPFSTYTVIKKNNKYIGAVPAKITRALDLISNDEEYPDIDIIVDGGLSTIYAYSNAKTFITEGSGSIFNSENNGTGANTEQNVNENTFSEDALLQGIEDMRTSRAVLTEDADAVVQDYMSVQQAFMTLADSFQNGGRGDCFYIPDVLRGILIRGRDTKVEKLYGTTLKNNAYGDEETVNHSWSTSILSPIKHLVNGFTSSYASIYAQWLKVNDGFTNEKFWVPASGYMAALMCASDQLQGPWYAAAGLNRGIVGGVIDCALNPNQKQRGNLYKICVNSVPKISGVGITCWGIRTLSKKASAFDQNTCRRTFLFIEKAVKKLLRYYLFEPNNSYTQLSIYNEIQPYMESIRNQGGIYSYSVVCSAENNTAEIVNAGNLAVDISAAPTRTAEFIVLNMTANKYTQEVSTSEFNG